MMRALFTCLVLFLSAGAPASAAEPGEAAPAVTLPHLLTGAETALADLRGKVVYVDFWASWCPPCLRSMPELDALRAAFDGRFEVYAINVDADPKAGREFLEGMDIDYVVLADPEGRYPARFGVKGMPTGYLLDREGVVRYVHEGYRRGDRELLRRHIERLLAER